MAPRLFGLAQSRLEVGHQVQEVAEAVAVALVSIVGAQQQQLARLGGGDGRHAGGGVQYGLSLWAWLRAWLRAGHGVYVRVSMIAFPVPVDISWGVTQGTA